MEHEDFRKWSEFVTDFIINYKKTISTKRVTPEIDPGFLAPQLPNSPPLAPQPWEDIMKDFEEKIMPGITHWQHPHFYAYFPSAASYPGIIADMLIGALGCMGFTWVSNPSGTELETICMDWLGQMFGLPKCFINCECEAGGGGGVIMSSASEAILTAMLAARKQAINYLREKNGIDKNVHDNTFLPKLIAYASAEAHSSVQKGAMITMLEMRVIPVDEHLRMDPQKLHEAMNEDVAKGFHPTIVIVTEGTTGTASFDSIKDIAPVVKEHPACWFHADCAYGGSMFVCPELRGPMEGMEHLDSIDINPNKWLLINYDVSCLFFKNTMSYIQGLVVNPLYLMEQDGTINYRHYGIPLSRRFRALKIWFTLRIYGVNRLQEYVRNHIRKAKEFEALILQDKRFEIVNEVTTGLIVFRIKGVNDAPTINLLTKINQSGKLHMIPTKVRDRFSIRLCINYEDATSNQGIYAWNVIKKLANEVLDDTHVSKVPSRDKSLFRRLSFTRSISREEYKRASRSSLYDGATPIYMVDDEDEEEAEELEDVFENGLEISEK